MDNILNEFKKSQNFKLKKLFELLGTNNIPAPQRSVSNYGFDVPNSKKTAKYGFEIGRAHV